MKNLTLFCIFILSITRFNDSKAMLQSGDIHSNQKILFEKPIDELTLEEKEAIDAIYANFQDLPQEEQCELKERIEPDFGRKLLVGSLGGLTVATIFWIYFKLALMNVSFGADSRP